MLGTAKSPLDYRVTYLFAELWSEALYLFEILTNFRKLLWCVDLCNRNQVLQLGVDRLAKRLG